MKLFATSYVQVLLITAQTYFISKEYFILIGMFGFLISFVWCFNVQRISISKTKDKIIYSTGASCGAITGILIAIQL
jgi:hypothetical protein